MAFSPEGIGAWRGLISDWRQESANRPYLQDLARANRDNAMASAEMKRAEAMYSPQYFSGRSNLINNQSDLTGEQAKYYGADTMSQIGLRDAQGGLARSETKFMPLKYAIEAGNSMRQNDRFGGSYQFAKILSQMDTATRATYIADHPEQYAQMLNDLGNKALDDKKNAGNDVVSRMANQFFPPPQDNLTLSPQDQAHLAAAGIAKSPAQMPQIGGLADAPPPQSLPQQPPMQQLPMNQPNQSRFNSTPEEIERLKLASQMHANQALTTGKTRSQMEGGVQLKSMLADEGLQERASNAAAYAGALGKGKAGLAALSQTNPNAYEDYLTFMRQDVTGILNRFRAVEGMASTDQQREELHNVFQKTMDSLTSNPDQFMTQFKNFEKVTDNIARGVQKSATPIFPIDRLAPGQLHSAPTDPVMPSQIPPMPQRAPAGQPGSAPQGGSPVQNPQQLQQMAQEAIAAGADPQAVNQHLQMLLSQGGG